MIGSFPESFSGFRVSVMYGIQTGHKLQGKKTQKAFSIMAIYF